MVNSEGGHSQQRRWDLHPLNFNSSVSGKRNCHQNYFNFLDDSFEKTFSISMDLYGISSGSVVKIYNTLNKQSRHLKCHGDCEPFTVLHLGFIDFAKYFIVVRFSDLKGVHERYHIKDVHFYVSRTSKEQISK